MRVRYGISIVLLLKHLYRANLDTLSKKRYLKLFTEILSCCQNLNVLGTLIYEYLFPAGKIILLTNC